MDAELDETTPNAGEYRFEKMVSGMYMGEVARRIILRLAVRLQCHLRYRTLCKPFSRSWLTLLPSVFDHRYERYSAWT